MRFDIETYQAHSGRITWDDLDFSAFRDQPLSDDGLRCIQYMHDIEFHTVCYLRDLLVTRAHDDHRVTTFLTIWNFEELYHGEALSAVLAAHDAPRGHQRTEPLRKRLGWRQPVGTLSSMFGSLAMRDFTAVHMMWGAVNEWTAQAGYARLSKIEDHPVLSALLKRIMRQEGRHVDFYASEAHRRLEGNRRAQAITRMALRRFWRPVGSGVATPDDVRFLTNHLFGGAEGRSVVERIDRRIQRLPGLEGLNVVARARAAQLSARVAA
jgi:hypothetical protein